MQGLLFLTGYLDSPSGPSLLWPPPLLGSFCTSMWFSWSAFLLSNSQATLFLRFTCRLWKSKIFLLKIMEMLFTHWMHILLSFPRDTCSFGFLIFLTWVNTSLCVPQLSWASFSLSEALCPWFVPREKQSSFPPYECGEKAHHTDNSMNYFLLPPPQLFYSSMVGDGLMPADPVCFYFFSRCSNTSV